MAQIGTWSIGHVIGIVSYFFTAEEACEVKNHQAHGEKELNELHKTITDG